MLRAIKNFSFFFEFLIFLMIFLNFFCISGVRDFCEVWPSWIFWDFFIFFIFLNFFNWCCWIFLNLSEVVLRNFLEFFLNFHEFFCFFFEFPIFLRFFWILTKFFFERSWPETCLNFFWIFVADLNWGILSCFEERRILFYFDDSFEFFCISGVRDFFEFFEQVLFWEILTWIFLNFFEFLLLT